MAQLFGVDRTVISKYLKNIFESFELQQDSVCAKFAHTAEDGKIYNTQFYNLDAVISVGYRVNSLKATRFRQWATKILNEYIKKGFVLDDDWLKQGETVFGQDYFQELLERIRSIRASERRVWQKITDIYAECSVDNDKNSPTTHDFYAMKQNVCPLSSTWKPSATTPTPIRLPKSPREPCSQWRATSNPKNGLTRTA